MTDEGDAEEGFGVRVGMGLAEEGDVETGASFSLRVEVVVGEERRGRGI